MEMSTSTNLHSTPKEFRIPQMQLFWSVFFSSRKRGEQPEVEAAKEGEKVASKKNH